LSSDLHTPRKPIVQPIAFRVSFNINLQSQSHWSLYNGTWENNKLDPRLRFEAGESTLQMTWAVYFKKANYQNAKDLRNRINIFKKIHQK